MCRFLVVFLAILLAISTPTQAGQLADTPPTKTSSTTYSTSSTPSNETNSPDLISFGGGYMNFDKSEPKTNSADFRFEYRWGYTFLGGETWGFHPFLGFETTSRNMLYGLGGFAMDWEFSQHGIFTWSEGAGYLDSGDQRSFGSTLEFRSQAELGYRFDNDVRLTAAFSHISNAKLTRVNPGAEIIGMYLHVPTSYLFSAVRP